MSTIKRIHIHIHQRRTTISMDATLYAYLQPRVLAKKLSVRGWAQQRINQLLEDKQLSVRDRTVSVSRRLQAEAIHLIASPCPDQRSTSSATN